MSHYDGTQILQMHAHYNIIFGERSNGKTYFALMQILTWWVKQKEAGAWLRRYQEDFVGKRGAALFKPLVDNGEIRLLTNDEWTTIYYFGSRWYLARYEEGKIIHEEEPLMYGFAISQMEHDKGNGFPMIKRIVFDEFITRNAYMRDEFILFLNCVSTIVRDRDDVIIFMLGNTVNKYCPYFDEMGLRHIRDMKQGTIDCYTVKQQNGKTLKIAVEFCKPNTHGKKSDFYFAFDNPRLEMITKGIWEMEIYPHCPYRYRPKDVQFTYFIEFDSNLLQCEVVYVDNLCFTYIHRKTTPLKNPDTELIFSTRYDARPNWKRKITHPTTDIERKLMEFYATDKIFYQDNEVGEIVRNYLIWCGKKI